jgi:hypothetical protein
MQTLAYSAVSFATRGNSTILKPPPPPRPTKPKGDHCWRATVEATSNNEPRGSYVGYDTTIGVCDLVLNACRRSATRGVECGAPELVLLTSGSSLCSGQVFFMMDGRTVKLF